MNSKLVIFFVSLFFSTNVTFSQETHVFVSAHPDDWQLFMNPNACNALKNVDNKVIFLHTTAGEAGHGIGNNSYYLAREEGSMRAIRFMCNAINGELKQGAEMNPTQVLLNGHNIQRFSYANAVVYFLRLPDGNFGGQGYPIHDHHSLKNFYEGTKTNIHTVDGSTKYSDLDELVETIEALIAYEANDINTVEINIADTNAEINPDDHSDHLTSSRIMQKVAIGLGLEYVNLYQEYATNKKEMNVTGNEFLLCAGTWGATASGLSDSYHYSTWDQGHNSWIGRQYMRKIKLSDLQKE